MRTPLRPLIPDATVLAVGAAVLAFSGLTGCVVEPARRPRREVVVAPPPPADVVIVHEAPPPLRVDVIPARPSPRHLWIRGYWRHEPHGYVWVPGRWVLPPRRGASWVEPRWEVRGGGYFFVEGHWN